MKKARCMKEKICAFIMVVLISVTSIFPPNMATIAHATEIQQESKTVRFHVQEEMEMESETIDVSGASVTIYEDGIELGDLTTDTSGYTEAYTIENPEASASYTYKVEKTGYAASEGTLDPDSEVTDVKLSMNPIRLSQEQFVILNVGETADLSIRNQIGDGSSYKWTSYDTSVATVENGRITAVSRGRTRVGVSRNGYGITVTTIVKDELENMAISVAPGTDGQNTDDKDEVTIYITGMEEAQGDVDLYITSADGTKKQIGTAVKSENYTVVYKDAEIIKGKVTFSASYKPAADDYYLEKEVSTDTISYKKSATLNLKESSKTITYEDTGSVQITPSDDSKNSGIFSYVSSNEDVATVDSDGKVTIKGAGKATITVSAQGDDVYLPTTAKYELTVEKKDVMLSAEDIKWKSASKVYDGKKTVDMAGTVTVGTKSLEIPVTVEVASADTGTYDKAAICEIGSYSTANPNYNISLTGLHVADAENNTEATKLTGVNIVINPRPVYIRVKKNADQAYETQVSYGTALADIKAEAENNVTEPAGTDGQINSNEQQGLINEEDIDLLKLDENTTVELVDGTYYVGTHSAIRPVVKEAVIGNYKLCVDENNLSAYCGRLQIVPQTMTDDALWSNVRVDEEQSASVYQDENTIWVSEAGKLVFTVKDNTYYDTINVKKDGEEGYAHSLTFLGAESNSNTPVSADVYLSKEGQVSTRTTARNDEADADNTIPEGAIIVDNKLPTISFTGLGNFGVVSGLPEALFFQTFKNQAYEESVIVNDDGSGLKEVVYRIVSVSEDDAALNATLEALAATEDGWIELPESNKINVPEEVKDGYYVVLVKATDRVGNSVVSCSNGLVMDTTEPSVTIEINEPQEIYGTDGVDYTLKISEPGTIFSGIDRVEVTVSVDGEEIEEAAAEDEETEETTPEHKQAYTDSYTLDREALEALKFEDDTPSGKYTIQQLKQKTDYVIEGAKIQAETCGTSNHVIISVTAYDMAGNEVAQETKELKYDVTSPEITVSYDNNASATAGYYQNRSMTIIYKERNFDPEKATFDLTVNGEKMEGVTIANIGKIDGISVTGPEDSEAEASESSGSEDTEAADYTDDRTNTYVIEFGADNQEFEYKIVPHIEDMSGNKNADITYAEGTEDKDSFVVDRKAPEVKVSYKDSGAMNGIYYNAPRKMTVTYHETYYDETEAMMQATVNGEKSVSEISSFADEEKAIAVEAVSKNETELVYEITFGAQNQDIDYSVVPVITDKAGNTNLDKEGNPIVSYEEGTENEKSFTVDMVAPVIRVKYEANKEDVTEQITTNDNELEWFYTKHVVTATVDITERNFRVGKEFSEEQTQMDLSYTATEVSEDLAVDDYAELAKDGSNWSKQENSDVYAASFEFKQDANYTLGLEYTDLAGNEAVAYEPHYFTVDNTAPTGQIVVNEVSGLERKFIDFLEKISFGIFHKEKTTVTFISEDGTSPYKQSYSMYDPNNPDDPDRLGDIHGSVDQMDICDSENPDDITLSGIKIDEWIDSNGYTRADEGKNQTETVEENTQKVPYMRLQDKAGNVSFYSAEGIIVDNQNPEEPVITITTLDPNTGETDADKEIFNTDVAFEISVTDPKTGETYAGLSSVSYRVLADGKETQESVRYEEAVEALPAADRVQTVNWTQDATTKPIVKAELNNSNNVVIEVTAIDNAGNEAVATREIAIDITSPEITVSYDNNSVANDLYFKADRVMTISYKERNFFEEGLTFDVTIDGVEQKGITMEALKNLDEDITVESGPVDSQAGTDMKSLTDERENVYTIRFGNENKKIDKKFVIVPHIQDEAANKSDDKKTDYGTSKAPKQFVIDEIAPVISVVYTADGKKVTPGTSEAGRIYESVSKITAEVTVTEHNFSKEDAFVENQMLVNYKAVDSEEKNAASVENYTSTAQKVNLWSDGNDHVRTFEFKEDANYSFGLKYTDLAGNEAKYNTRYFTVDDTKPTGTIYTESDDKEGTWDSWNASLTFGFFNQAAQIVRMTSDDKTSGVKTTQYYKYIPDVETRGEFDGLTVDELERIGKWTNGFSVLVSKEQQAVVYEKIVDRAGNVTYINTKEGVIVDDTDPQAPEITITTAEPAQDVYAGDVNFTMHVTDPVSGDTYSGLKEVYYEIRNNGTVTQSGNYNSELTDHTARRQSVTKSETVNAQLNNSNFVEIYVRAVDYAGNESEATKDIKIDITAPEVTITFDNNSPLNGKYYKETRTATVSVKERNFDPNAVHFTITNSDGTQPSISGWTISSQAGMTDDAVNTCTVTFSADGDYNMSMNCSDLAGNSSNTATIEEFTVDKTLPTISVSFDNNNVSNGRYYNAPRTATITVVEHNFNGSEVQTAIRATLEAQGITAPGVNGWSGNGDTHTATVHFQQDGDYSFTVNYTDLAGNAAQVSTVDLFTVDQTKPVVEIFDIEDKSANNGEVAPGVRYSDVNYDVKGVSITIKGPNHQVKEVDGTRSAIPNGQSIKMEDFAHEESVDDIYTLTATVTDYAGNSDEQEVVFSVNRFGSNYIFGENTEKLLEQYYSNEEQELVVTEINVDTLEHYGISYGRDGELVNLQQGTDYTINESGNDASWKSYTYTIKADNFEQEGMYDVTIDSRDRATNEVNNKIKDANIEFVIDKTAPSVVITGIEDDKQYRASERDMTVSVADNVAVGDMDIYVDNSDKSVQGYDAETILEQNGEVSYTLGSSSKWQRINVVARDAAGNVTETAEFRVLITTNLVIQFVRNIPLLIGTCIAVAAVIFIVLLFAKRRKKEEKVA